MCSISNTTLRPSVSLLVFPSCLPLCWTSCFQWKDGLIYTKSLHLILFFTHDLQVKAFGRSYGMSIWLKKYFLLDVLFWLEVSYKGRCDWERSVSINQRIRANQREFLQLHSSVPSLSHIKMLDFGGGREIGTDIYTALCKKQVTNKDLLYSTGNSAQ